MPRRYPREVRRQVVERAGSGRKVWQLVATFGMSEATIYNWLRQERIDRGEISARAPIWRSISRLRGTASVSSRLSSLSRAASTKSFSSRAFPQKALPGDRVLDRAGKQHPRSRRCASSHRQMAC